MIIQAELGAANQSASWANATTGSDAGSMGLFFQRRRPVSFTTNGTSIVLARFSTVESAHPSRTAIACLQRPLAVSSRIRSSSSAVQSRRRPIRLTPLAGLATKSTAYDENRSSGTARTSIFRYADQGPGDGLGQARARRVVLPPLEPIRYLG